MSLFDFFFPNLARAQRIRDLTSQGQAQSLALQRQRLDHVRAARAAAVKTRTLEQRVAHLELELGQAGLAIEALLELLEEKGTLTREAFAARLQEIDLRDGVADGRVTPSAPEPAASPVVPKRPWPGR